MTAKRIDIRTMITMIALTVMAAFTLAACNGSDSSPSNAPDSKQGSGEAVDSDSATRTEADESAPGADTTGQNGILVEALQAASQRDIIYTLELNVTVQDVAAATREASSLTKSAGGFVANEFSDKESSTVTLKVPSKKLEGLLTKLEKLGSVNDRSRTTEDVTDQVVDTQSRIDSQRASIARIRTLLDKATKLADIIAIESELSRREADLDALLSRQKELGDLTSMATITATFSIKEKKEDKPDRGFIAGIKGGWKAFTSSTTVALTVLGALLPFLALALLISVPALWFIRNRRQRARAHTPISGPAAPTTAPQGGNAPPKFPPTP